MDSGFTGFVLVMAGLGVYLLPALVAGIREHKNVAAIAVLNLLLGWTVLGWVGALVWAFTANAPAEVPRGKLP